MSMTMGTSQATDRPAQHGGDFPETDRGDFARAARIGFAGDSAASARGGLSRRQERAVLAGSFAARPKPVKPWVGFEGLPGEFSQHDFGQVDVEFLNGTRQRRHPFLRLAVEVLALHGRQFGEGRERVNFGANAGGALGQLGWAPVAVCI